ncbi:LIC12162 family protein [Candidatus Pelagibacter sp.]|nr:LIC12162 family protein [Candidatus Pelagibacter sp.]
MRKKLILNLININLKGKKNRIILNHPNSDLIRKNSDNEFFLSDNRLNTVKHLNYINRIYEKNLTYLARYLNSYHKVNYSKKYWRILIGIWLHRFISLIFDRWISLNKVSAKYKKIDLDILKYNYKNFIPYGIEDFNYFIEEDEWNNYIYFEIIKNSKFKYIKKINKKKILQFRATKEIYRRLSLRKDNYLSKILDYLYSLFLKTNNLKYYIFDTYRSNLDEIKINFLLNKRLLLFKSLKSENLYPKLFLEKKIFSKKRNLNNEVIKKDFNKLASNLCIRNIPMCYLEFFNKTNEILREYSLPKKPKVIFSTRGIAGRTTLMDLYTADKAINGSKIIIAQHGGNYGQHKLHPSTLHEFKISNKFLSWGFRNGITTKPLGIIRSNLNEIKYNKNNKLILFETRPRNLYSHILRIDSGAINGSIYLQKLCEFFLNLKDKEILDQMKVKMSTTDFGLKDKNFLIRSNNKIKFLNPKLNSKLFYDKAKLVIHTFPGTGHLEVMASNVPNILFFLNDMKLMKEDTKKYFLEFKKLGILHDNSISLINHLRKISDDPAKWWFSKKIQYIRKKYCNNFAILNKNLNSDLVKILKRES